MHWIRRYILSQLTLAPQLRYTQLRPAGVETNLFTYHVRGLVTQGYLQRKSRGSYTLTTKGKRYVGHINVDTGRPRPQPKIVVMLVARNRRGEYLLFKWRRQPFYGLVSFPYGKTDFGKSVYQNAREELYKKAGLLGTFKWRGDVYVKTLQSKEVLNHMLVHVFAVTSLRGSVGSRVRSGSVLWGKIADFALAELAPGTRAIEKILREHHGKHFFEEITENVNVE